MLTVVSVFLSVLALALSVTSHLKMLALMSRVSNLDEKIVRSVMEEGGDASVEAVLQTVERLMDMDDGTLRMDHAIQQAREMHKR